MGFFGFGRSSEKVSYSEVKEIAREFERAANKRDARPFDQQTSVWEMRRSARAIARDWDCEDGGDTQIVNPPKDFGCKDGQWMKNAEFFRRAKAYLEKQMK